MIIMITKYKYNYKYSNNCQYNINSKNNILLYEILKIDNIYKEISNIKD